MQPQLALIRRRLAGQFLIAPGDSPIAVVRALAAVQAQDYAGAKWAVAQRTAHAADADLERELTAGRILRTHLLRPTWHFVAREDIRWLLALTAPRVMQAMAYHMRVHELTPALFRKSNVIITRALAGGNFLTRTELGGALERARIKTEGRMVGMMMRAELEGLICSGPRRGKQATYALLDERVPPIAPMDRDAALLELARRYFETRGPATARDFAWWSGLTVADARRAVDIASSELARMELDGDSYFYIDAELPRPRPSAHLLPNYDEFFIGYKDRSAVGTRLGHAKHVIGGNASISNVVFVDGQLVGGWRAAVEKKRVVVTLRLDAKLTPAEQRRVNAAAARLGSFHGLPVSR